jgi:hypothetical protein
MASTASEYFAARGFELLFVTRTPDEIGAKYEQSLVGVSKQLQRDTRRKLASGAIGPVFAALRAPGGNVLDWYGYGIDEESAGLSAMRRWKVEQGD